MESRFKSDMHRMKKKYEANIQEIEIQLDAANKANANLSRENKTLAQRITELTILIDDEHRAREAAESNLQVTNLSANTMSSLFQ